MVQITMKPDTLVVFEGLDATGKSTQLIRLHEAAEGRFGHKLFTDPAPMFTHQPSGGNAVGNAVYAVTENGDIASVWARQFLHLASHAEHYARSILPALGQGRAVFMDRCWWSTVAYGYYGGKLYEQMSLKHFIDICTLPARGRWPDVVFLFQTPWKEDHHNTPSVMDGYEQLSKLGGSNAMPCFRKPVIQVPAMSIEDTTAFIFERLAELGLTA